MMENRGMNVYSSNGRAMFLQMLHEKNYWSYHDFDKGNLQYV